MNALDALVLALVRALLTVLGRAMEKMRLRDQADEAAKKAREGDPSAAEEFIKEHGRR